MADGINSGILNYRGNAAQAGGYGPDGIPTGTGADSNTVFNNVMQDLARQNTQWNVMSYQQKLNDRDEVLKAVADNQVDIDVEDVYRPQLEKQIEAIKKINLANPDIKSNPKAWDQLQSEVNKFKEMKTYAKTNSAILKAMKLDYANNPDARYRQTLGEHINSELGKGITHLVQPYQKLQDWTAATDYVPDEKNKVKVLSSKNITDKGVSYKEIIEGSDLGQWEQYYSPYNLVEGENKNLPDEMAARAKAMLGSKQFTSPQNLNAINSKLDAINKANKLNPGDQRYLPPIATDNGDGTWNIEKDPGYLNMAASLFQHYEIPKVRREVDEKLMKARGDIANINQSNASAESSRASAAEAYNRIKIANEKLDTDIDHTRAETEKLRREGNDAASKGAFAAQQILDITREAAKSRTVQLTPDITVAGPKGGQNFPASEIIRLTGLGDNASMNLLPVENNSVKRGLSWPVKDPITGKVTQESLPVKAYVVRDGNNIKYVAMYKTNEEGKDLVAGKTRVAVYDAPAFAANLLSAQQAWNLSDKDNISIDKASELLKGTTSVKAKTDNSITRDQNTQLRQSANGIEVNVDGEWRKVIGKDGDNIFY